MRRADTVRAAGPVALAALLVVAAPAAVRAQGGGTAESAGEAGSAVEQGRILDGIVAVVDGDPVTLRELKRYAATSSAFLAPEDRGNYRAALESMIENRLLGAEFRKHGIAATDEMVEGYIDGVLQESGQSRTALVADVERAGLTWDEYFERMRQEVQRIQLVNLLIRSRVNVPAEEVREVWENDPTYLEDEKLEIAVIFLPASLSGGDEALEKAREVQRQAERGFSSTARKHSKGPAADEGGNLGSFGRGTMAPHFEEALSGLEEGDVSEPVQGPGGYYIVKLVDVHAPARRDFEDVREQLAAKLYEERLAERYRKWATEDLREDHRVEILLDRLAFVAAGT